MFSSYQAIVGRKIKLALVGCGRIAANHVQAIIKRQHDCELVAICDIDATHISQLLTTIATTCSVGTIQIYHMLEEMLNAGGFDAVILATPSGLHSSQAIKCAKYGFHVITEKPMATKYTDGLAMVKACDDAAVRLFVVKQNRQNATIKALKQAIVAGRFGRIYNVCCNVFWTRPQQYYDQALWRGTWEFDGGAFMNQASHYVDLLEWLIGPVESVQSFIATLARNIAVEDSGVVALRWRSGALGTMNVSMLTYPKNLEGSITIIGEHGTVKIGGIALNKIEHWQFAKELDTDKEILAANYDVTSVYGHGHYTYYDNVIQTLKGEVEPYTDGREGLKSLELIIAIYLSARDNKRISLPLQY